MCTNLYLDLWNIYFIFLHVNIYILIILNYLYINKKFKDFKILASNICNDHELRNNSEIRLLFCSLTLILTTNKHTILDDLNYKFNFQIENIYENLKAPNLKYIDFIYKQHDPKEFIIPFNELIYHLKDTKNKIDINYWINWIIHYDALCNSKRTFIMRPTRYFYM